MDQGAVSQSIDFGSPVSPLVSLEHRHKKQKEKKHRPPKPTLLLLARVYVDP